MNTTYAMDGVMVVDHNIEVVDHGHWHPPNWIPHIHKGVGINSVGPCKWEGLVINNQDK